MSQHTSSAGTGSFLFRRSGRASIFVLISKSVRHLLPEKRKSLKIFGRGLGGQEIFLEGNSRRWGRFVCDKGELEVINDPVHHGEVYRILDAFMISLDFLAHLPPFFSEYSDKVRLRG
jgi:hypothetical protein